MLRTRFVSLSAVVALLLASTLLHAQQASVSVRIVQPIDESRLTTLSGGVSFRAQAEFDRGQAPASTQMTFVRLVLSRSPQQEAALQKLMAEQLDRSSPNYHKWLTPEQFGKLYGPADSDIETLVTWLQSRGFTVQPVAPGGVSIAFSGSVSQIEAAFHTEIHAFNNHGTEFLSNISNPKIPSALAPVISGIAHLNTLQPRPHHVAGPLGTFDSQQKHFTRAAGSGFAPSPLLTGGSGTVSDPYSLYVVPGDAATIYDTPNSFNANFSSGTSYNGTGVTIGVGGDSPILGSTVASYRNRFLGNSTQPTITNVATDPATSTDDQDEAYLDTEITGGLAPGATIHFYTAANLENAIEAAISDNTVDVFSLSFGECEAGLTTADNALISSWWQQFSTAGVPVLVSSGDSGSAGCDDDNTEQTAQYGLQVSGFASTPYNIAVGGTDYVGLVTSFTTYVSTANSSSTYYRTALSYIPESTWNDSTDPNTTISANVPLVSALKTNIVGGSGGASSCSTNTNTTTFTNCTSGYPKPIWQRGIGVPSDHVRDLPDISILAGNGLDGAAWLVCTDDTGTVNGSTVSANCTTQTDGNFYFFGFGGTSTSAPGFAGMLALVQQQEGSRLGLAAKEIYDLYNGPHASAIFHDITVGNNSVPCTTGTPNCSQNAATNYFLTGYNTNTGYDLATGIGSVDVTQLIKYWNSAIGSATSTVSVVPAPTTITTNQALTVTGAVTGSAGTATGSVTLTSTGNSGTYTSPAATLSSGSYSISIPAGSLKIGSDTLTVKYTGDSNYAAATGTGGITVTALTPAITVTPASTTIASSQSLSVTVKVAGTAATPTGTVTLTAGSYTSGTATLSSGSATIVIPADTFTTAGLKTISVSYTGDTVYASGSGSATVTVTVPLAPTVTVTPGSGSITTAQPLAVAVTVTGTGATPTGTVTLTSGSYSSGAKTLISGAYAFAIPAGSLAAGSDTLSVSYSGDSAYSAKTGTASVTVTALTPTVTVTPASTSIDTGQSLAVTVKVAGTAAAPTGTVTLTSGSYTSSATSLSSGSTTITIPANTLAAGTDTISASYSGDTIYATGSGSASVTVTASTFAFSPAPTTPAGISPGSGATSTVTVSSSTNYSGSVAVTCALTTSPTGASDLPTCTVTGSPITLSSTTTTGTAMANVTTTAASAVRSGSGIAGLAKAGAATLLAFLVFLGIPARRRAWRALLGVLVLIAALGTLSACGSSGTTTPTNPGTTAGTYTFTVTGTGTPATASAPTATITVTVN